MTVVLTLIILALIFGLGAVIEGIAWALLISLVLLVAAGWYGWSKVRGVRQHR